MQYSFLKLCTYKYNVTNQLQQITYTIKVIIIFCIYKYLQIFEFEYECLKCGEKLINNLYSFTLHLMYYSAFFFLVILSNI